MLIRKLNEKGIEKLKDTYQNIKDGNMSGIPDSMIYSDIYSEVANGKVEIQYSEYSDKESLVKYISGKVRLLEEEKVVYNVGLWSWLSIFFFNLLCPYKKEDERKIGAIDRHILNNADWRRYYRHLLACPVRLYQELGDTAKIYLNGAPDVHGDLLEQLASTQEIATNMGIIEAATILYWDQENQKLKRGSRSKQRPGNIRRFAREVIPQFQMTFDLNTMSGKDITELLPDEFNEWKI